MPSLVKSPITVISALAVICPVEAMETLPAFSSLLSVTMPVIVRLCDTVIGLSELIFKGVVELIGKSRFALFVIVTS